jgi:hypothetical protein
VQDALSQFQGELERVGLRVVPHRDHLCVRLPLFASVRVHVLDGELKLHLQAGPTGPGRLLTWTALITTALVAVLAAAVGVGTLTITAGFGGIALMMLELGQLVLADGCATRLMLQWSGRMISAPARATLSDSVPSR